MLVLFANSDRFGWVNASYTVGLSFVTAHMKRALGTMTDWKTFERATQELDVGFDASESSRDLGAVQQEYSQTSHHLGGLQGATGHAEPPTKPANAAKRLPESHAGIQHNSAAVGSSAEGGSATPPANMKALPSRFLSVS